jgi:6-phosphogluconolactonase
MTDLKSLPRLRLCLSLFSVIFLFGALGWSQNLLTNPGFETGDLTGWTITQNSPNYGVATNGTLITGTSQIFGPFTVLVHSGNYAAYSVVCEGYCYGGLFQTYIELSQTLTLTPGQIYTASYWLGNGYNGSMTVFGQIELNGRPVPLTIQPYELGAYQYGLVSGDFIASQANNTISYFITNGAYQYFSALSADDLSLTLNGLTPGDTNFAYMLQENNNQITSYQVDSRGLLIPAISAPFATGTSPVSLAATSNLVYVADKGSSQISGYLTNFTNGRMAPVLNSPYAADIVPASIAVDAPMHFVYATGLDSGGNGAISGWRYAPTFGTLTPLSGSPFHAGTNPSGIAFDRSGRYAYVADTANNELLAYSVNLTSGALTPLSGSPFHTEAAPVAIVVDTAGNFLYVADSGGQRISGFKIADNGELTAITNSPFPTGNTPVALALDATQHYLYVANSGSSNIWAYQVNPSTGVLSVVTDSPFQAGSQMHSITSLSGYVYTDSSSGVWAYQINPGTGKLTPVPDSPIGFFGTFIGSN